MKRQIIGLTALLAIACSSQKENHIPEVKIPEIILQQKIIEEEPIPQAEETPVNNEYHNLGKQCSQIKLQSGKYPVKMKNWDALYTVDEWNSNKNCYLVLRMPRVMATISDQGCDNNVDGLNLEDHGSPPLHRDTIRLTRDDLERLGYKKQLERLLDEAQQFACPENEERLHHYLLKKVLETYPK